jgi:hypothetical protein
MKGMDGNPIQIEAPPSKDLQVALMQLKKYAKR